MEVQSHSERRVRKRVGKRVQFARHQHGALRGEIQRGTAAALIDRDVLERAIALDRELDVAVAGGALVQVPDRSNALNHERDVVGTTEVGDVERRTGSRTTAGRQTEALAAG